MMQVHTGWSSEAPASRWGGGQGHAYVHILEIGAVSGGRGPRGCTHARDMAQAGVMSGPRSWNPGGRGHEGGACTQHDMG